jgi:Na+-transporting NADH:ubiquinone oxidoreductase subunit NqrB
MMRTVFLVPVIAVFPCMIEVVSSWRSQVLLASKNPKTIEVADSVRNQTACKVSSRTYSTSQIIAMALSLEA